MIDFHASAELTTITSGDIKPEHRSREEEEPRGWTSDVFTVVVALSRDVSYSGELNACHLDDQFSEASRS